jgi:hypothetical protein
LSIPILTAIAYLCRKVVRTFRIERSRSPPMSAVSASLKPPRSRRGQLPLGSFHRPNVHLPITITYRTFETIKIRTSTL